MSKKQYGESIKVFIFEEESYEHSSCHCKYLYYRT